MKIKLNQWHKTDLAKSLNKLNCSDERTRRWLTVRVKKRERTTVTRMTERLTLMPILMTGSLQQFCDSL